jgi:hypothetical protein
VLLIWQHSQLQLYAVLYKISCCAVEWLISQQIYYRARLSRCGTQQQQPRLCECQLLADAAILLVCSV